MWNTFGRLPIAFGYTLLGLFYALHGTVSINCGRNVLSELLFEVGTFHPQLTETEACRPISSYIQRGSERYINELVMNTNPQIDFHSLDSQMMTSRLKLSLDKLADMYYETHQQRIYVVKAWAAYPDPDILGEDYSLHYEGRTVRLRIIAAVANVCHSYNALLNLALEAGFDWVYYANQSYVQLSVLPSYCNRRVDCVFILDQSNSVGPDNHNVAKTFIKNVVSFFNVGPDGSQFGLISFSTREHLEFSLNDNTNLSSLLTDIDMVRYRGGWSAVTLGLNAARDLLNPKYPFGARPDSDGIPKIAILITDGNSNLFPVLNASLSLKRSGVQLYTVGIGRDNEDKLKSIASQPSDEYTFLCEDIHNAVEMADFLSARVCDTPAVIERGYDVTGTVVEGGIEYFQTACTTFSTAPLVEITDERGTSFLYCSSVETTPGPLTGNTISSSRGELGVTRRTCSARPVNTTKVVYIGVFGVKKANNFTLSVWDQLFPDDEIVLDVTEGYIGPIYDVTSDIPSLVHLFSYATKGDIGGLFHINLAGVITVETPLNYTKQRTHTLTVVAQNINSSCQRARFVVHIRVVCNQVYFNSFEVAEVNEDARMGDIVTRVSAFCGDYQFKYSIAEGNATCVFNIDETVGAILINGKLDFESMMNYTLTIRAVSINSTTFLNASTSLSILVTDVNELPFFITPCAHSECGCHFSLYENLPAGYQVGVIEGADLDFSCNTLTYEFTPFDVPFRIDSQGRIMTVGSLDREQTALYTLNVSINDGCGGFNSTVVEIEVLDKNDNQPIFIQALSDIRVQENLPANHAITQYVATDPDVGVNKEIQYSLSSETSVPFILNSVSGVLTVNGSIDYEMANNYTLFISAYNPNYQQSAMVISRVDIDNVNDNSPLFSQPIYFVHIVEHSSIGTTVIVVSAIDADLGEYGEVSYSIESGNFEDSFQINHTSGEIYIARDIDRESVSSFNLTVVASDVGEYQAQHDRARVSIVVADINDNAPVFITNNCSARVLENRRPPADLINVIAYDNDEHAHPNSQVQYTIVGGNTGEFELNVSTGLLLLIKPLDFEAQQIHQLLINACDMGVPQMNTTTNVTIKVINVNDHVPVLNGNTTIIEVSESLPVGSLLTTLEASDVDGMTLWFGIISGNEEGKFSIQNDGRLLLNDTLDYETTCGFSYGLVIGVSDGALNSTTTLTVIVLEENEYAPEVTSATDFSVVEEEPVGIVVGMVNAVDNDGCANESAVTYHFVNELQYFEINAESGAISTRVQLDRDNLFLPPLSVITTELLVRDTGTPPIQFVISVTFRLLDINDNSPVFDETEYYGSLLENLPAGQTVFHVSASDSDYGNNGEIAFSFRLINHAMDSVPFALDPDTGIIITSEPLDCEKQSEYVFIITAKDRGIRRRSSYAIGYLSVIDTNDHAPTFGQHVYHVEVNESVPVESDLFHTLAYDSDKGRNGEVQYTIANSCLGLIPVCETLMIDLVTGVLMNKVQFDFESFSEINVTIAAHDLGTPNLTSNTTIVISILNEDEEGPHFVGPCNAFVSEGILIGGIVTQCIAVDPDNISISAGQTAVSFNILYGNEKGRFHIDTDTGILRTSTKLDREEQPSYHLTLEAVDLTQRTTSTSVLVTIEDINDNPPHFLNADPLIVTVNRTDIKNYMQNIANITAVDPDNGNNGTIRYKIENVNRDRGLTETVVEIVATDMGTPRISSNLLIHVFFDTVCALQNYEIDGLAGALFLHALCQLNIEPSGLNLTLGDNSKPISCNVLSNIKLLTYQWILNERFVTSSEELRQGIIRFSYHIGNAKQEDAGMYACKVSSSVGSLQTKTITVNVSQLQGSNLPQRLEVDIILGLSVPFALVPAVLFISIIGIMEYKKFMKSKRTRTYATAGAGVAGVDLSQASTAHAQPELTIDIDTTYTSHENGTLK